MKITKVSVVMCVHNGAETVAEAIESILNQTFPHLEFIILDDGSTDFLERRKPEHRGRVRERIMEIDGPIDFVCSEASSFESKNSVVDVAVRSKKRDFGI